MGILTIKDCGTAHERQLLDIYNGLMDKEKESTGKELTLFEKSNIELQVAEAYQSILLICNDGGRISKALEILKERIPTIGVNEISKVAVDVVAQVSNTRDMNQNGFGDVGDIAAAAAAGYVLGDNDKGEKETIEIPPEISNDRAREFENLSEQAHQKNATHEVQSSMVGLTYEPALDAFVKLGLKFNDIDDERDFSRKCEIIKIIKDRAKAGNSFAVEYYCKQLGITEEDMENPEYNAFDHVMDTRNQEEDKVMNEINGLSSKFEVYLDYAGKANKTLAESYLAEIMGEIQTNQYSVDVLFGALSNIKGLSEDRTLYGNLLGIAIERFNDPNVPKNFDGWLLRDMIITAQKFNDFGETDRVQEIVDVINRKFGPNNLQLSSDNIVKIDAMAFEEFIAGPGHEDFAYQPAFKCLDGYIKENGIDYRKSRDVTGMTKREKTAIEPRLSDSKLMEDFKIGIARAYKEGGDEAARQCFEDFAGIYSQNVQDEMRSFVQSGAYREIDTREPKKVEQIDPVERKRQALEKMLNAISNGKGLERAQEKIKELIATYPDKRIAIDAALNFLESQKDSNSQFMSADTRETREGVFEAIVLTGIEEPEIYERMQELDRATSKVVVNQVLGQINDSRMSLNKVLGAVQMLGKNLNQRTEPTVEDKPLGFLDPDKTTLPTATLLPEDKGDERDDF